LADLQASQQRFQDNQELIQRRIDQLAQQQPPYVPGFGPETRRDVQGTPVVAGAFPRSFLIPGTDTSMRIGGFINGEVVWWLKGAATGGQLNGQGGNLAGVREIDGFEIEPRPPDDLGQPCRGAGSSAAPLAISVFLGLQSSRSAATFQASPPACVGWGAVNPGGVYSERTKWK